MAIVSTCALYVCSVFDSILFKIPFPYSVSGDLVLFILPSLSMRPCPLYTFSVRSPHVRCDGLFLLVERFATSDLAILIYLYSSILDAAPS